MLVGYLDRERLVVRLAVRQRLHRRRAVGQRVGPLARRVHDDRAVGAARRPGDGPRQGRVVVDIRGRQLAAGRQLLRGVFLDHARLGTLGEGDLWRIVRARDGELDRRRVRIAIGIGDFIVEGDGRRLSLRQAVEVLARVVREGTIGVESERAGGWRVEGGDVPHQVGDLVIVGDVAGYEAVLRRAGGRIVDGRDRIVRRVEVHAIDGDFELLEVLHLEVEGAELVVTIVTGGQHRRVLSNLGLNVVPHPLLASELEPQSVRPGPAFVLVLGADIRADVVDQEVGALLALDLVVTGATRQDVVPRLALDLVIAVAAEHGVGALAGVDVILAGARVKEVIARPELDVVVAVAGVHDVGALARVDVVVAIAGVEDVVPRAQLDLVLAVARVHRVVTLAGVDVVLAATRLEVVVSRAQLDLVVAVSGGHGVVALAGVDVILAAARVDEVVPRAAVELVVAVSADQMIVALLALQIVLAITAIEDVVPRAAPQLVLATASQQNVVVLLALQLVIAGAAIQGVVPRTAFDLVVVAGAEEEVIPRLPVDLVVLRGALNDVVAGGSVQLVRHGDGSRRWVRCSQGRRLSSP